MCKLMRVCLAVSAWCLVTGDGRIPGAKLQFTKYGVNYAATEFTQQGIGQLVGKTIPDVEGTTDTDLGDVDYSLKNMRVTSIEMPTTTITFPDSQVHAQLLNAGLSIDGDWHYKLHSFIPVSDGDSFSVSLKQGTLELSVKLGLNGTKVSVAPTSCSADLHDIDFHIHGSTGFIYEWLISLFEDDIQDKVQDSVCQLLTDYIYQVNQMIQAQDVVFPISDTNFTADLSFLAAPNVSTSSVTAIMKGETFWRNKFTESHLVPGHLAGEGNPERMANGWLSSYSLNTAGEVAHKNGVLDLTFTQKDLPDDKKYVLNTTCPGFLCIGNMISQLAEKFPNSVVNLNMTSTAPPVANLKPGVAQIRMFMQLDFVVVLGNGTIAHAFTTSNIFDLGATATVSGDALYSTFSNFSANTTVTESDVGDISSATMTALMNELGTTLIIPTLNDWGAQGAEIPGADTLAVVHPSVTILQDTILISTDLLYQPKESGVSVEKEKSTNLLFEPTDDEKEGWGTSQLNELFNSL